MIIFFGGGFKVAMPGRTRVVFAAHCLTQEMGNFVQSKSDYLGNSRWLMRGLAGFKGHEAGQSSLSDYLGGKN